MISSTQNKNVAQAPEVVGAAANDDQPTFDMKAVAAELIRSVRSVHGMPPSLDAKGRWTQSLALTTCEGLMMSIRSDFVVVSREAMAENIGSRPMDAVIVSVPQPKRRLAHAVLDIGLNGEGALHWTKDCRLWLGRTGEWAFITPHNLALGIRCGRIRPIAPPTTSRQELRAGLARADRFARRMALIR